MLEAEATWIGRQMLALGPASSPVLNVGCSTLHFRTVEQPWIESRVFAPLRRLGVDVVHIDTKPAIGVDIVADITDPDVIRRLGFMKCRTVLCSNLLEHVSDRRAVAANLELLVPPGGHAVITCPRRYPYHPDPIDSLYRPSPVELASLFPELATVANATVEDGTFLEMLARQPRASVGLLARIAVPFVRFDEWRTAALQLARHLPWTFRRFSASCVVLGRPG